MTGRAGSRSSAAGHGGAPGRSKLGMNENVAPSRWPRRLPGVKLAAFLVLCAIGTCPALVAQYGYGPPEPPPPPDQGPYGQYDQLPPLQQLLAPVALYPDPLIGMLLPAATEPYQIQQAAGFINAGYNPDAIDSQPWHRAVKGLAHYPDVTRWMADNFGWTQQVGAAFAQQPDAVMDAIQHLRRRALDDGVLHSTPQEQVIQEDGFIRIVPAQPDTIFVPRYNPYTVFFPGMPDAYLAWGPPRPAGPWLVLYPDWAGHDIWVGDWFAYARRGGWGWHARFNVGGFGISIGGFGHRGPREYVWHVPPDAPALHVGFDFRGRYGPPRPMYGTPGMDRYWHGRPEDRYRRDDRRDDDRRYDDHRYDSGY